MSELDETVASHVPSSIRQMGTESRTDGRSSHLGSTVKDSLSSQNIHLNFYSLGDRLNGKFLNYLGALVTDGAGGTRFQGAETAPGYITTTAYIAIDHAHRESLPTLTLSPVEQSRATTSRHLPLSKTLHVIVVVISATHHKTVRPAYSNSWCLRDLRPSRSGSSHITRA